VTPGETTIRRIARDAIAAAGLLLAPGEFAAVHAEVARRGTDAWRRLCRDDDGHRDAPAALGLDVSALTRVLGFGHVQAGALAEALHARDGARVGEAGALLNLGVGLFDWIADRHPQRSADVQEAISPASLDRLAGGAGLPRHGEPGVDLLFAVVEAFFAHARAMAARPAAADELLARLHAMLEAQLAATAATRDETEASAALWGDLEAKSVLPMQAMALLPVLGEAGPVRASAQELGRAVGGVLWRVDDLVDAGEDWDSGAWSRPWLLHTGRCRGGLAPTASREEALACLVADGVASSEAAELARRMREIRGMSATLDACVHATVQSWIGG
jgi:hypothetical protein